MRNGVHKHVTDYTLIHTTLIHVFFAGMGIAGISQEDKGELVGEENSTVDCRWTVLINVFEFSA